MHVTNMRNVHLKQRITNITDKIQMPQCKQMKYLKSPCAPAMK